MIQTNTEFWRDRPTFVTGATGLVGGWLVKSLVGGGRGCRLPGAGLDARLRAGPLGPSGQSQDRAGRHRATRKCWSARWASTRSTRSFIWPRRPSSASPTATRFRRSRPTSQGTWRLLEACRRSPKVKQIVIASSDKAYGDQEVLPYDETTPLQGQHPYDVSKSCADLISYTYAKSYDLPVTITRCGNFYGGGDLNWNRIVPGTIRSILRGQAPVIRSDGSVHPRLFLCRGRRGGLHAAGGEPGEEPEPARRSVQLLQRDCR